MKIKLNAGDKIQVPANCKATIEDNLIIIEKKQDDFKDGDILHSNTTHRVVIFQKYLDRRNFTFCSYYNNDNSNNSRLGASWFHAATEDEKQAFFDDLKAKGLRWNAETKQMERIRERVKYGDSYLFIDKKCKVSEVYDNRAPIDNKNWEVGNYYLLSEIEQAEEDAKAIKAIFEKRLKV